MEGFMQMESRPMSLRRPAVRAVKEDEDDRNRDIRMIAATAHRMIRYRILAGDASGNHRPGRILKDQRQLRAGGADRPLPQGREGTDLFRSVRIPDRMPAGNPRDARLSSGHPARHAEASG